MDEEIKARLLKALDGMLNTAGQIKDFAIEEAPKVIQDYVKWGFWEGLIGSIAFILAILGCLYVFKRLYKFGIDYKPENNDDPVGVFALIASWLCLAATVPMFWAGVFPNVRQCAKAAYAPRAYIIDTVLYNVRGQTIQTPPK